MSPLRYQKWLRLNEVRRQMLNEHYDVTTAAYAVGEQNNILPYSARLKSTQKSVNPGLVRASATFTLEFQ